MKTPLNLSNLEAPELEELKNRVIEHLSKPGHWFDLLGLFSAFGVTYFEFTKLRNLYPEEFYLMRLNVKSQIENLLEKASLGRNFLPPGFENVNKAFLLKILERQFPNEWSSSTKISHGSHPQLPPPLPSQKAIEVTAMVENKLEEMENERRRTNIPPGILPQ